MVPIKVKKRMICVLELKQASKYKSWVISLARFVFLAAFSYILLYPILYMMSNAFRTTVDYIDPSVVWVPKTMTLQSFWDAFQALKYPVSLKNTLVYEIVSGLIEVFTCSVFAYGLSRFKFRFKPVWMFFLILTIMIPDIMLLLPRVMNFKQLDVLGILGLFAKLTGLDIRPDIYDTPLTFYLPSLLGVGLKGGMFIFIYMQFFSGLPAELEEAAWIDGAGPLRTFLRIIIPSSGVVFLTVTIFSIIWHWNDYYLALMYVMDDLPLAVMVHDIKQQIFLTFGEVNGISSLLFGVPPAACLLFLLPPLGLYLFLQKYFIQSIDRVGIVG